MNTETDWRKAGMEFLNLSEEALAKHEKIHGKIVFGPPDPALIEEMEKIHKLHLEGKLPSYEEFCKLGENNEH